MKIKNEDVFCIFIKKKSDLIVALDERKNLIWNKMIVVYSFDGTLICGSNF